MLIGGFFFATQNRLSKSIMCRKLDQTGRIWFGPEMRGSSTRHPLAQKPASIEVTSETPISSGPETARIILS
jgi:hypothetical protein